MARHRHDDGTRGAGAHATADRPGPGLTGPGSGLRIDKWLWCARFFRTRGLAQAAVEGGHVQVNGERVKASRQVKVGDRLHVVRAQERFEVDVLALPTRRGPAPEARQNYRETPESEAARAHVRELNRLSGPVSTGRPDKRERRDLLRLLKGRGAPPPEPGDDA